MQDSVFDELTKKLAAPISRRLALKTAIVTAMGGFFALNRTKGALAACPGGSALCTAPNGNSRCLSNCAVAMYVAGNGPGTGCQCCNSGATCTQNGQKICAPSCPGGTTLSGCTCVTTCAADEVLCNGNCVDACPNGSVLDAFCNCQCLTPTCGTSESQVCCASGQYCRPSDNTCQCATLLCKGTCCSAGQICYNSVCTNLCMTNADCPSGQGCAGGALAKTVKTAQGVCATTCSNDGNCGADAECIGGTCCPTAAVCGDATDPSEGSEYCCPPGTVCVYGGCVSPSGAALSLPGYQQP